MEEHIATKKRLQTDRLDSTQAKTAPKETPIRDEADEISEEIAENSKRVHEIILRAVVRIALTLVIFGGMFYYFMSLQGGESQEERVNRNMQALRAEYAHGANVHQSMSNRNRPV